MSWPPCGLLAVMVGSKLGSNSEGVGGRPVLSISSGSVKVAERALAGAAQGRRFQFFEGELGQELLGRGLIVVAAIGPEQFGEFQDLRHQLAGRRLGMRDDASSTRFWRRPKREF